MLRISEAPTLRASGGPRRRRKPGLRALFAQPRGQLRISGAWPKLPIHRQRRLQGDHKTNRRRRTLFRHLTWLTNVRTHRRERIVDFHAPTGFVKKACIKKHTRCCSCVLTLRPRQSCRQSFEALGRRFTLFDQDSEGARPSPSPLRRAAHTRSTWKIPHFCKWRQGHGS